jgi:hypothetical protein
MYAISGNSCMIVPRFALEAESQRMENTTFETIPLNALSGRKRTSSVSPPVSKIPISTFDCAMDRLFKKMKNKLIMAIVNKADLE